MSKKMEVFQNIVSAAGEGFPLSSLRDRANELMNSEIFFSNRELIELIAFPGSTHKKYLFNYYGDDICCSSPQETSDDISKEFQR